MARSVCIVHGDVISEVSEVKLGNVHLRRGDWEIAESHFLAALASLDIGGHTGERSSLAADLSLTAHHMGRMEEAAALAQDAVGLAEAAGDRPAQAPGPQPPGHPGPWPR